MGTVVAGLGLLLTLTFFALEGLPPFGKPIMLMSGPYLQVGLSSNGAVNYVTSILLDFRGYDTLGEATIIFAAIVGVYAVIRQVGRKRETSGNDAHR
jgi:multisubunit Na+/H+ antiporter MnhB subunit